jgi:hypothetical protein
LHRKQVWAGAGEVNVGSQRHPQPPPQHARGADTGAAAWAAPFPALTPEAKIDISRASSRLPQSGHSACGSLRVTKASNELWQLSHRYS